MQKSEINMSRFMGYGLIFIWGIYVLVDIQFI